MLAPHHHDRRPLVRRDPADWRWAVRRADGSWLTRPAPQPGAPAGNMDPWTRRIPDAWDFDSEREAREAAVAHGSDPADFTIVCAPRRGGEWLRGEGAYGDKPVTTRPQVRA